MKKDREEIYEMVLQEMTETACEIATNSRQRSRSCMRRGPD
nr:hypothetical protein [uncultured Blautia sp.]